VAILENSGGGAVGTKDSRVQIGAIVKMLTPGSAVVGIVSALTAPSPSADSQEETGLIEINLAGEVLIDDSSKRLTFKRGVTQLPSIGDPVLFADHHDLTRVFAPPAVASVKVGTLFQDAGVPARLLTDDLLAKHFIVVGSTGSGKSCALTTILQRLLGEHAGARVVILDLHNEYAGAFDGVVEKVTLSNFNLPFWLMNFAELSAALTSKDQHRDAEIEILSEAVVTAKRRYAESSAGRIRKPTEASAIISVDTPTPFRLSDVTAFIDDRLGKLERTYLTLPYRRLKTQIESLVADQRYNFMFGSLTVQDTMTEVLSRLFRIPNDGRPVTVVDLSTAPPEILDVIISVISRLAFELAVWSNGAVPMLLVCEEAHRYAPAAESDATFAPTRRELSRIAKEGRKYALSLALVTQRPSDLDPNILSQCGTAIAMRLSSERDQQVIRANTYEGMVDLLDFLPLLSDREAIVLGQGVSMPMRIRFDLLTKGQVPKNMNTGFSSSWKSERLERASLDAIVTRWRLGGRE
jgi:DNA helicase HerA-like ATPase